MKTIIITEKPSVAREYASVLHVTGKQDGYIEGHSSVLDKDIIITWAVGHLILLGSVDEQREQHIVKKEDELKWNQTSLPIFPSPWFYKTSFSTLDQYKVIKSLYKSPDIEAIYYAGDSGREGIYIQALIRNFVFGNGTIESTNVPSRINERVVWIDSYTESEILRGIREAKPYHYYDSIISAGYERAKWDWLMGMNFSRSLTAKSGTSVAVGRVMSPTLNMIVTRQEEIDNFISTPYFGIKASCPLTPTWKASKTSRFFQSDLLYNETGFLRKTDAENLINELSQDSKLLISDITVNEKKEYAPLLYNLADIQAECAKTFHITPDETLSIAQSLYEKKLITYPRTDARVLSSAVANELCQSRGFTISSKYIDDSKITDHYAVIPTFKTPSGLDELSQSVYNLIYNRFLSITKPPHIYDSIKITYTHSNKEQFFAEGKTDKQLGWRELYTSEMSTFQTPSKGSIIGVASFDLSEQQTKPPIAYTTGTLILAMEKAGKLIEDEELREQIKTCGIGTSATRANIITKLQKNGYITIDKKQKVTPTDLGKQIIHIIAKIDKTFINPEKTAELEQKLNDIAEAKLLATVANTLMKDYIAHTINTIEASSVQKIQRPSNTNTSSHNVYTCPYCNGELVNGLYGYWCKTNKDFKSFGGHKLSETDVKAIINKGKTKAYTFTFQSGKTAKASIKKGTNSNELEYIR